MKYLYIFVFKVLLKPSIMAPFVSVLWVVWKFTPWRFSYCWTVELTNSVPLSVYMWRQILCSDYFLILLEFLEYMCNTLHHRGCARDYACDDVIGVSSFCVTRVAWLQYAVGLRASTTRDIVLCTRRHNQHHTLQINYYKRVTKRVLFLQETVSFSYSDFKYNVNQKSYYTVTTKTVIHISEP